MASAIAAARQQINDVGADGDLDGASARGEIDLDVDSIADPIELPDGKLHLPAAAARRADRRRSPARCWTCSSRAARGSCA